MNFWKKPKFLNFSQVYSKGGTLWCQNGKFSFFNFLKFHISFFKNGFTGTKGIQIWTKSWIMVTLVIKLWKWETAFGRLGPKWPPLVGIGLILGLLTSSTLKNLFIMSLEGCSLIATTYCDETLVKKNLSFRSSTHGSSKFICDYVFIYLNWCYFWLVFKTSVTFENQYDIYIYELLLLLQLVINPVATRLVKNDLQCWSKKMLQALFYEAKVPIQMDIAQCKNAATPALSNEV